MQFSLQERIVIFNNYIFFIERLELLLPFEELREEDLLPAKRPWLSRSVLTFRRPPLLEDDLFDLPLVMISNSFLILR